MRLVFLSPFERHSRVFFNSIRVKRAEWEKAVICGLASKKHIEGFGIDVNHFSTAVRSDIHSLSRSYWSTRGNGNRDHKTSSKRSAWSALSSNLSQSGMDYTKKCSKSPLLDEILWSRLPRSIFWNLVDRYSKIQNWVRAHKVCGVRVHFCVQD